MYLSGKLLSSCTNEKRKMIRRVECHSDAVDDRMASILFRQSASVLSW